jgi:hypothetical protein
MTRPGQLHYVALDGVTSHWPGPDPWQANQLGTPIPDLDLFQLRIRCIETLRKVEDELERRGLLNRVTSTDYREKK